MSSKSDLNELCQAYWTETPQYETTRSDADPGEDHDPNFDCKITLPDGRAFLSEAHRGSKTKAEDALALYVVNILKPELCTKKSYLSSSPLQRRKSNEQHVPEVDDLPQLLKEAVLHRKFVARVTKVHTGSIEAVVPGRRGKVRIGGPLAEGVREGMLISVRIESEIP